METKPKVTIVTHSGRFHSDDVFGVATLYLVLEKDHDVEIVRTRDQGKIDKADYVVDVGSIHDPDKNRFDHHQTGGAGIRQNGIPYASFGLVRQKYGEKIYGSKEIADEIDRRLILPIDAQDNGIDITKDIYPGVDQYGLRDINRAFRTTWKEDESKLQENFLIFVDFAKKIIMREIAHVQARNEANALIAQVYKTSEDKRLLILDKPYPWDEIVTSIPDVLLVVYPKIMDGTWGVQAGRDDLNSYKSRICLPENWAGKSDTDLEKITGVEGLIFCHNNRFMAVAKTKESAIELAHLALKEAGQ